MYYLDKAKMAKYAVDEQEIKNYMEANNVMQGIFYVANKVYNASACTATKTVINLLLF
jgi:peptidyl-dipeptidase Dcp